MKKLAPEQIKEKLVMFPEWEEKEEVLECHYEFDDFKDAFSFLTGVALISEKLNHHPFIMNEFNKVSLAITTHEAEGLTDRDFTWIEAISKLTSINN